MDNYKKNDPRMWFFYSKVGRIIIKLIIVFIIVYTILQALDIVE